MPIKGDYKWSEKSNSIKVQIPLKGVSNSKVDIFVTTKLLKVNFNPYIVDLVLANEVDAVKHKATIKDGVLGITLFKQKEGMWGSLVLDTDADKLDELKRESMKEQAALNESLTVKRTDRKIAEEKYSLKKQMALEEADRDRLDALKLEEKQAAERDIYDTFAKLHDNNSQGNGPQFLGGGSERSTTTTTTTTKTTTIKTTTTTAKSIAIADESKSSDKDIFSFPKKSSLYDIDEDEEYVVDPDGEDIDDEKPKMQALTLSSSFQQQEQKQIFSNYKIEEDIQEEIRYVPPPRSMTSGRSDAKVEIKFSPRIFPTPKRESKAAEEEDWVAKNRRYVKNHGVLGARSGGTDVSEEDSAWLKAKADDFFRSGDFQSALNAYNAALDADAALLDAVRATMVTGATTATNSTSSNDRNSKINVPEPTLKCLSNRSACNLRLGLLDACKSDCSLGLQIIALNDNEQPVTTIADATSTMDGDVAVKESNAVGNKELFAVHAVKLLARRGACCCQMGAFTEALSDYYSAASRLERLPASKRVSLKGISSESLKGDIIRLKLLTDADRLKKEGDAHFAEKDATSALAKYDQALIFVPVFVSALSNRAACKMVLGMFQECVNDCSIAIDLLQFDNPTEVAARATKSNSAAIRGIHNVDTMMLTSILPPVGSDRRRTWLVKTLSRRGVARWQMIQKSIDSSSSREYIDDFISDFQLACDIEPANEALKRDLQQMVDASNEWLSSQQSKQKDNEKEEKEKEKEKEEEEDIAPAEVESSVD